MNLMSTDPFRHRGIIIFVVKLYTSGKVKLNGLEGLGDAVGGQTPYGDSFQSGIHPISNR